MLSDGDAIVLYCTYMTVYILWRHPINKQSWILSTYIT